MNILSVTTQKPHSTGSGTYLSEVVRALDRQGHRQAVVAGIYHSDIVNFPEEVNFHPVYYTAPGESPLPGDLDFPVLGMSDRMPYPSTRYSRLTREQLGGLEKAFISAVGEAIDRLRPDIILCHHLYLLTAILRKAFPEQRIYGICHGSDLRQMQNLCHGEAGYGRESFSAKDIQENIRSLNRIFALHQAQKKTIMDCFRLPAEQVSVIGTGYNDKIFFPGESDASAAERPHRFIYAGKICREKGIPELLDALEQLRKETDVPFELHLAGGCTDSALWTRLNPGRNQPPKACAITACSFPIQYHGLLSQKVLANLYRNCHTFVLPSYFEGLPLVLIEAMACGLNTLCNDLPGVREWLRAEIPENATRFIPLPPLISSDRPDPDALPQYVFTLKAALKEILEESQASGQTRRIPDTSGASWDAVAKRIVF